MTSTATRQTTTSTQDSASSENIETMARTKRAAQRRRAASATPQRIQCSPPNFIDLTQTDPLAERSAAVPARPGPISPAFSGRASTVAVPQDPKSSPAYLFQQLALAKHRSRVRPSFSSKHEADRMDGQLEDDVRDETPTPTQQEVKQKRKRKAKEKKEQQPVEEAKTSKKSGKKDEHSKTEDGQVGKKTGKVHERPTDDMKKPVEGKKRTKEASHEPTDQEPATRPRKRKRQNNKEVKEIKEEASERASEIEANATTKLRESLPTVRLARVARDLQLETGDVPTDLAVLATAARETIIDLARQQLQQTERSYQAIQAELLTVLKKQNERLERLEGRRARDSSSEDSDDTISRARPDEACKTN